MIKDDIINRNINFLGYKHAVEIAKTFNLVKYYDLHSIKDNFNAEIEISKEQGHFTKSAVVILNKMIVATMFDYLRRGFDMKHGGDVLHGRFIYDNFEIYNHILKGCNKFLSKVVNNKNPLSYFTTIIRNYCVSRAHFDKRNDPNKFNRKAKIANVLYNDIETMSSMELESWLKREMDESKELGFLTRGGHHIFNHLIISFFVRKPYTLWKQSIKESFLTSGKLYFNIDLYFFIMSAMSKKFQHFNNVHPNQQFQHTMYFKQVINYYFGQYSKVNKRKEKIVNILINM